MNGKLLIEQLKQLLPSQSSLLEIGSGPGSDWEILQAFYKVTGSEIFKGLFVNYHTVASQTKAYQNHFEILSIEAYNEFDVNDSLLMFARKK